MTLDDIVAGFEKNLELERELGVKTFELDRALLNPPVAVQRHAVEENSGTEELCAAEPSPEIKADSPSVVRKESPIAAAAPSHEERVHDFLFVHDKPLSPKAQEMMDKAIAALGSTGEKSPVISGSAVPPAKIYVFLGPQAAKKLMPSASFSLGSVQTSPGGKKFLVTHSPEQVLRFSSMEMVERKMKVELWGHINIAVKAVRAGKSQ